MTEASDVSLGGETAKATVGKFAMAAIGFVGTVLFARLLGSSALGGFYLLLSLIEITAQPFSGFSDAGKKRASEADTDERVVVGAQLLVNTAWTGLLLVAVLVLSGWLDSYTGFVGSAALFALIMIPKALYSSFVPIVQSRGRIGAAVGFDALRSYLTFPLQLVFVLAGAGAAGMAYGLGAATFLTVPVALYYIRAFPSIPTRDLFVSLWEYARYSIPTKFLGRTYMRFDTLLLGFLLTQSAAGDYGVAARLTLPAVFVANMVGSGLMVRVSNLRSKGRAVSEDVSNSLAFSSIIAVPIFFGAAAIPSELIVTLYGEEFLSAVPLLVGIAFFRLIRTQSLPLTNAVNGFDRPDVNLRLSAVTLTINIVAGYGLTVWLGAIGVVIATTCAEILRYVGTAAFVRKELSNVNFFPKTLLEQFVVGTVMFLVVRFAANAVPVRSWVELAAIVSLGAAVYGGALLLVSHQLRVTIQDILQGSQVEHLVPNRVFKW